MFHTIITTAYIIPNIYLFLRVWHLFINKGYKLIYTMVYLLIAILYPVSNLFSDGDNGFAARVFNAAGDYVLPFYLYFFLLVLVFDICLVINMIFKIIPKEKFKTTHFKKATLPLILLLSAGIVIAGVINFNTIRTTKYQIEIPGRSSKLSHLKIGFVADFHLKKSTNINFVKKFAQKIDIIKPDIMLFGGDIVEGDSRDENMTPFENLIKDIKTRYGSYAVLGNHEYYAGQDKGSFFDKAGVFVLCDTIIVIDSSFSLGGRYDSHRRTRKSVEDLMRSAIDSLPLILVDHRPTEIDQVSKTAADVQLSGHTHNGQLFPISLITGIVYDLSWGYRKIRDTHFFVTSGIRLWGPPVRTSGKSEIMVIDIVFK